MFDAQADDVDVNVTVTADSASGVEFFADRSMECVAPLLSLFLLGLGFAEHTIGPVMFVSAALTRWRRHPSFSHYTHFSFVPQGKTVSTLLCVHQKGPFYFGVRPVAVGAVPSISVQVVKHDST